MWAIRFLNGKLAGQTIPLQIGNYTLGRSEECQIVVAESGVSKKHLELEVTEEGVSVIDLRSSNGTFINGIKIQEKNIQKGDKVSVFKTTFDIIPRKQPLIPHHPGFPQTAQHHSSLENVNPEFLYHPHSSQAITPLPINATSPEGGFYQTDKPQKLTLKNWFKNYMDKVVLPGVYKLPEWLEFKWVIAGFLICFVLTVTSLSAIPLIQILNSSIEQESINHAESIATTLAQINRESIQNQILSAVSVEYAQRRPGVTEALIISAIDGKIISPPDKAHTYSKIPFINEARRKNQTSVKKIDSSTVAAMVPIQFYNTQTDTQSAHAYAAVLYNLGTLAFGNKRTISLLVQTFFLSIVIGSLLFFFMYKMIEHPIISINDQLSSALKDESLSVQSSYEFEPLQNLTNNINSTLSRMSAAQDNQQSLAEYDRQTEMNHLIELIGYPTLGINMERMNIEAVSAHFEEETGVSTERILHRPVDELEDQALKLNIKTLIEKVQQHSHEIAYDSLEFSGVEFQLSAKGIYGKDNLAYTLITFIPTNQQEGTT